MSVDISDQILKQLKHLDQRLYVCSKELFSLAEKIDPYKYDAEIRESLFEKEGQFARLARERFKEAKKYIKNINKEAEATDRGAAWMEFTHCDNYRAINDLFRKTRARIDELVHEGVWFEISYSASVPAVKKGSTNRSIDDDL